MKKFLILFSILILLVFTSIFGLLFTDYGNKLIASYIENRVNSEQDKVKFKVDNLKLTFKTFDFNANIDDSSYININGDFELFNKSVDLKYDIKIDELSNLKPLTNSDFRGRFFTNGTFVGDEKSSVINGVSNFASGETKYILNLKNFKINNILLSSKKLKLEELFFLINKPSYAKGSISIDADIKNFKSKDMQGNLKAKIEKSVLNNEIINKEYEQSLTSNINFESEINSDFIENSAILNIDFKSSLFDIVFDKLKLDVQNMDYEGDFNLFVKNLEKLESFIGKRLKGELQTNGNVKSKNRVIFISGDTNIINSKTKYSFNIEDKIVKNLKFKVLDAKVDNFFKLIDEPVYAVGNFEANGSIDSFKELNGKSTINLKDVKLINEVINAVYNQELRDTIVLNGDINSSIKKDIVVSDVKIISNIASLDINKLIFDIKSKETIGNYIFFAKDLSKLKDFTKSQLSGELKLVGDVKLIKEKLYIDGKSNIANGNFDFKLNDNILNANLKGAELIKLFHMFNQKEFFSANTNLALNYNIVTKRGDLKGNFLNGHFLQSNFTKLVEQFTKLNLTKEIYENSKLDTKIDDKLLVSNLIMQSLNSKLEINNSKIDLEKNTISTRVDMKIKENSFAVNLENDLNNPTLSFDLKSVLERKIDKNIDKLGEKLNKALGKDKGDDSGKEILKELKRFF